MDTLILQFLCGQLRVSGGCRMDDQTLNVSNICQQRKDLQLVNELKCCFLSALISKVKMDAPPFGKYFSYRA